MADPDRDRWLAKVRADPLWLFRQLWPNEKLWSMQEQVVLSVFNNRYTSVKAANGVGKSFIAGRIVPAFMLAWPGCEVVTTATTWDQVEKVLWKEIRDAHQRSAIPIGGKLLDTELKLNNSGWIAYGLSTNKRESFLGHHSNPILVVEDEASGIDPMIDEGTRSIITSDGSRLLKIGNPIDPVGHFFDSFKPGSLFNTFSISAFDSPNFTAFGITETDILNGTWQDKITGALPYPQLPSPQWVADRLQEYGADSGWYQCFVKGEFPQQSADSLISLAWCMDAVKRTEVKDDKVGIGVDVARFGSDETVIALYNKGKFEILDTAVGQNTMKTAGKGKLYFDEYHCPVGVDDIGVGGGVTDRLEEQRVNVFRFVANEKAIAWGNFANKSTAAMWKIREALRTGIVILPNDDKLIAQLTGRKYKIASDGQIELESKDAMRKRGLSSPDRADAMAMAYWAAQQFEPSGKEIVPLSQEERERNRALKVLAELNKAGKGKARRL